MAARLFHRLSQIDALEVRRLVADAPPAHPILRPAWGGGEAGAEKLSTTKPS